MTRGEVLKASEVLKAWAEGKEIQSIIKEKYNENAWYRQFSGVWKDSLNPVFDFERFNYRIKPPESISIPATMHELKAIKSVDWYKENQIIF